MKEIKKQDAQERKAYVPASVKVMEVTARRVLCSSTGSTEPGDMTPKDVF